VKSTRTPPTETLARVAGALDDIVHKVVDARDGMPTISVERDDLTTALERLKSRAGFEQMTFVTGVDHMPAEPRFEVVHQLWSLANRDRVRVKTRVRADDAWVPTCVHMWPGASFMERECFDMFGIRFEGHPDLRRLLMPEEYEHHPLRKDFPHHGIEPDKLYRAWERERREEFFRRSAQEGSK
jgi:NADH-quinone oxidoreductase subunit C